MLKSMRLFAVAAVLIFLVTGCTLREKINKSITEGIIEQTTGDNIVMKFDWPEDQAAAHLPKLNSGTVSCAINTSVSCTITVDGLVLKDYQEYEEAIADAGFTNDMVDSSTEDMEIYSASSSEGIIVTLSFITSEGSLQITLDTSKEN